MPGVCPLFSPPFSNIFTNNCDYDLKRGSVKLKIKYILCLMLLIGVYISNEEKSYACSCAQPASVQSELKNKAAIFSGKVIKMKETDTVKTALIEVDQIWKGPSQSQIMLKTATDSAGCGMEFIEGENYLVYAYGEKNHLETGLCERTTFLSDATEDLNILGSGKEPEKQVNLKHQLLFHSNYILYFLGILLFGAVLAVILRIEISLKKSK